MGYGESFMKLLSPGRTVVKLDARSRLGSAEVGCSLRYIVVTEMQLHRFTTTPYSPRDGRFFLRVM
jgi:hypothetical protein